MKIEIFKDRRRQFRLRLIARNGRKLVVSEGYQRRAGAMRCFRVLRKAFENQTWNWK